MRSLKLRTSLLDVLTEEKYFFRNELCDLRRSCDLFTRHVHRDAFHYLVLLNKDEIPDILTPLQSQRQMDQAVVVTTSLIQRITEKF